MIKYGGGNPSFDGVLWDSEFSFKGIVDVLSKLEVSYMIQTLNTKIFLNPIILVDETAKNITAQIESSNLNVSELQNLFGFEQPQAIYNWREGKSLPSLDNIIKLAYFLHTSVDELVVSCMRENQAKREVPQEFRLNA